jgi:hypothetical protein
VTDQTDPLAALRADAPYRANNNEEGAWYLVNGNCRSVRWFWPIVDQRTARSVAYAIDLALAADEQLRAKDAEIARLKDARYRYADDPDMVWTDDHGWLHTAVAQDFAALQARVLKLENALQPVRDRYMEISPLVRDKVLSVYIDTKILIGAAVALKE